MLAPGVKRRARGCARGGLPGAREIRAREAGTGAGGALISRTPTIRFARLKFRLVHARLGMRDSPSHPLT